VQGEETVEHDFMVARKRSIFARRGRILCNLVDIRITLDNGFAPEEGKD
jgi:hypothetical protein